jgi:hypothetical protein
LPNFSDSRPATALGHRIRSTQAMATTASSPETETKGSAHVSAAISKKAVPRTMMTFMLLRT